MWALLLWNEILGIKTVVIMLSSATNENILIILLLNKENITILIWPGPLFKLFLSLVPSEEKNCQSGAKRTEISKVKIFGKICCMTLLLLLLAIAITLWVRHPYIWKKPVLTKFLHQYMFCAFDHMDYSLWLIFFKKSLLFNITYIKEFKQKLYCCVG